MVPRCEKLCTIRTTVLIQGSSNIPTIFALNQSTCRERTVESDSRTHARLWTGLGWLRRYLSDTCALVGVSFAFCQCWKSSEVLFLVRGCVWVEVWYCTINQRRKSRIINIQIICGVHLCFALRNILGRYIAFFEGFDQAVHSLQASPLRFAVPLLFLHHSF